MDITGEALEVRVYVGENDRHGGSATSHAVVVFLRENGCAGATVLHGVEGFGHASRIHTASILRLSEDLPVVVIAVDRRDRIEPLLGQIAQIAGSGLVTVTPVEVVKYGG